MPRTVSLAVVGADYPNPGKSPGRRFEIALCAPGDPVELVHEPKNKADGNAIMIVSERGVCMGYVSADRTSLIHRGWHEAQEVEAIFQEKTAFGAWIRVGIGQEPMLPTPTSATSENDSGGDPDTGFWPDPEWPDD